MLIFNLVGNIRLQIDLIFSLRAEIFITVSKKLGKNKKINAFNLEKKEIKKEFKYNL